MLFNFQIFGNFGLFGNYVLMLLHVLLARNPYCITIVPLGSQLSFRVIKNKEKMIFYFPSISPFQEISLCGLKFLFCIIYLLLKELLAELSASNEICFPLSEIVFGSPLLLKHILLVSLD